MRVSEKEKGLVCCETAASHFFSIQHPNQPKIFLRANAVFNKVEELQNGGTRCVQFFQYC